MSETAEDKIARMAALTVSAKRCNARPAVLLLGAGASMASGVPSWRGVCDKLAAKLRLGGGDDPIQLVREYFRKDPDNSYERFWTLYPEISCFQPSSGFDHLAYLVSQGYIGLIITTNWDPLVEIALAGILRPDQYRVLVRGEMTDNMIARAIRRSTLPKVLKLHGDLSAQLFHITDRDMPSLSDSLRTAIIEAGGTEMLVLGSSLEDPDVSALLMACCHSTLHYINPETPLPGSSAHTVLRSKTAYTVIDGVQGRFDEFFTSFDMDIQRVLLADSSPKGLDTEKKMLAALERGVLSIGYQALSDKVADFARKIRARQPDMVAFINDEGAPGGLEMRRRMAATAIGGIPQLDVPIKHGHSRIMDRRAVLDDKVNGDPIRIVLIDSVAFSGNTLKLAVEALEKKFPYAEIIPAVLVAFHQFKERSGSETWLNKLIFEMETDRHEISFPWGSTFSTRTIDRSIEYLDPPRNVQIFRSPWGCGEILADRENCSVRVLTIEAGQKLSFQRHLCRDEFFVALDDEVGFDLSGTEFSPDEEINEFDPRIRAVTLNKGDYFLVPRGIWHRSRAPRNCVRLLEIGFGIYDEKNDIERKFDMYGRSKKKAEDY